MSKKNSDFQFRIISLSALITIIIILSSGLAVSPWLESVFADLQQDSNKNSDKSLIASLHETKSGNYIINFVYEIELNKPNLKIDRPLVVQGDSFSLNGTNFDKNSTIQIQAFKERRLVLFKQDKIMPSEHLNDSRSTSRAPSSSANQTITGLFLAGTNNIVLHKSSDKFQTVVMEKKRQQSQMPNNEDGSKGRNGTIILATKFPSTLSEQIRDLSAYVQCQSMPDNAHSVIVEGNNGSNNNNNNNNNKINESAAIVTLQRIDDAIVNNSSISTKRFFDGLLPAGNYGNCEINIIMSSSLPRASTTEPHKVNSNNNITNAANAKSIIFRSMPINFTLSADNDDRHRNVDSGSSSKGTVSAVPTDVNSANGTIIINTNKSGSFNLHGKVGSSIQPGSYVFVARQLIPNNTGTAKLVHHPFGNKIAIAALQVMQREKSYKINMQTSSNPQIIGNNDNHNNFSSNLTSHMPTNVIDQHAENVARGSGNSTISGASTITGGSESSNGNEGGGIISRTGSNNEATTGAGNNDIVIGNGNNDNNNSGSSSTKQEETQQPPATSPPPSNSGDNKPQEQCTTDFSTSELRNGNIYTNSVSQTSLQNANNININNSTITVTQKIIGIPDQKTSPQQHITTTVDIKSDNNVTQLINQKITQKTKILDCFMANGDNFGDSSSSGDSVNNHDSFGGMNSAGLGNINATNSALSAALQDASNIYQDDNHIKIQQTMIIPKYCTANIFAPVKVYDKNAITQTIDQDIVQKNTIKIVNDPSAQSSAGNSIQGVSQTQDDSNKYSYSSSLQKNIVTQIAVQGASNVAVDNNIINISQAIIVPSSCNADVFAPILVQGNSDVKMVVNQKIEQTSTIKLLVPSQSDSSPQPQSFSGIAIASAVTTTNNDTGNSSNNRTLTADHNVFTNTILTFASQSGENAFYNNNHIEVTQQIFYVNDTNGWTLDNYQKMLLTAFPVKNQSASSSSVLPLPLINNNTASNNYNGNNTLSPSDHNQTGTNNENMTTLPTNSSSGGAKKNSTGGMEATTVTAGGNNSSSPPPLLHVASNNTGNVTTASSSGGENQTHAASPSSAASLGNKTTSNPTTNNNRTLAADNKPKPGSSNATNTIHQFNLQNASNYNQSNRTIGVSQNVTTAMNGTSGPANTTASISQGNGNNQSNQQTQLQRGSIAVNGTRSPPTSTSPSPQHSSDTTSSTVGNNNNTTKTSSAPAQGNNNATIVNNNIKQVGAQIGTNYNEQNSNTTVTQGIVGSPVNATTAVTHGNNINQYDGQDQGQKAAITTASNNNNNSTATGTGQ